MKSREAILERLQRNKPRETYSLPEIPGKAITYPVPVHTFIETLIAVGGRAFEVKNADEVKLKIKELFPEVKNIAGSVSEPESGNVDLSVSDPHVFEDLDVFIAKGEFGVAENGAIWVTNLSHRVLPFICQHLVIIINASEIVSNMIEAYKKIQKFDFGVFISGPSKTADIEQSLIIGAHGARSLTVFII